MTANKYIHLFKKITFFLKDPPQVCFSGFSGKRCGDDKLLNMWVFNRQCLHSKSLLPYGMKYNFAYERMYIFNLFI